MRIDFVTLFPEMVLPAARHSILARAEKAGLVSFGAQNPRDHATDRHRTVDDAPYGGGPGMVLMAPVVEAAVRACGVDLDERAAGVAVVLTDPAGSRFTQASARDLGRFGHVVFVCGHYEGVDERVSTRVCTHAYSIGDFVLTGGELAALVMADSVVRLLPGVLGDPASHEDDSHSDGLLGFPLYTRPLEFRGERVPDVLTSGHHGKVAEWRRTEQLRRTKSLRPDLFCQADLRPGDAKRL